MLLHLCYIYSHMIKQWEEFPVGPKDVSTEMHVTLSPKGEIVIGAAAFERFGRPDLAVLLFDKVNSLIGVVPASSRAKNAYPLVAKTNARHRIIRANRFCRHYGIQVPRTVAFNKPEIDDEGVLVLDIKGTRVIGKARA